MKFATTVLILLLIAGCQPSQNAASTKKNGSQTTPTLVIDTTTPDKALKSYWQAKDVLRKILSDMSTAHNSDLQTAMNRIGFDPKKLMAGDVLSSTQENLRRANLIESEYSREIEDVKLDTESRATAIVTIRNSTPIPQGIVFSEGNKKQREEGDKFKYILEKEADGWRVAQVYVSDELARIKDKGPWRKLYSTLTDGSDTSSSYSWVAGYSN